MKRRSLSISEAAYNRIYRAAVARRISMSAVVEQAVRPALGLPALRGRWMLRLPPRLARARHCTECGDPGHNARSCLNTWRRERGR